VRQALAVAVAVLVAAVAAGPALGDGDPASDILFTQPVFLPFTASPTSPEAKALKQTVVAANRAGVKVRVAIIASRQDLGAVPSLFGQPTRYARFLGGEISFGWKALVLVAMPAGLGISRSFHPAPAELAVVQKVKPQPGVTGLERSAELAVRRLAAAKGHRLPVPTVSGGGSSDTRDRIVIGVAAAVAAALAGAVVFLRRRRRARS
jgi:hypothetical protein